VSDDGKKDYPRPSLTADVVVVAGPPGARRVLFVKRGRPPFQGMWALPGGFVEPTETVAQAAVRELREETSLTDVAVEELGCFSKPGRDPRGWVVTIAHLAVVPERVIADARAGDDAADTAWLDLETGVDGAFTLRLDGQEVRELAFDHREIMAAAVQRLVGRP
jgi:8-oxo-dGTP diphosphatase